MSEDQTHLLKREKPGDADQLRAQRDELAKLENSQLADQRVVKPTVQNSL